MVILFYFFLQVNIREPNQPITFSAADPPSHVVQNAQAQPVSASTPLKPPANEQSAFPAGHITSPRRSPRQAPSHRPLPFVSPVPSASNSGGNETQTLGVSAPDVLPFFAHARRSPRKHETSDVRIVPAGVSPNLKPRILSARKLNFPGTVSPGLSPLNAKKKPRLSPNASGSPKLTSKGLSLKSIRKASEGSKSPATPTAQRKLLKGHTSTEGKRYTFSYVNTGKKFSTPKRRPKLSKTAQSGYVRKRSPGEKASPGSSPGTLSLNKSGSFYGDLSGQYDSDSDFETPGQVFLKKKRKCDFSPTRSRTHVVPSMSGKRSPPGVRHSNEGSSARVNSKTTLCSGEKTTKSPTRRNSSEIGHASSEGHSSRSAKRGQGSRFSLGSSSNKKSRLSRSAARREAEKRKAAESSYEFTASDCDDV